MDELDRNRLEEFRQLRQAVRHSEEYLIVGIDVAKDQHHAFFGTPTGKTLLKRLVFSNDYEGFRKLLDQAEALRVRHGLKKVVYGMEPTANYHKPLGEYLIHLGRCVVLVSGVSVKKNRETLDGRWDKHDEKDSANVEELCKPFPEYQYLLTIPGFGPDVSAKVLGAIGDPDRFQNGKQVMKLAGLDLSADRSGKNSDKAIPEISKRGKADLRYALYQAALIASTRNHGFMVYYTRKLRGREKEKGIHVKMYVKLSAKMLLIAWTLMKKKEAFDPAYLNAE